MTRETVIRSLVTQADREAVRAIVASTGFFSAEEAAVAVELVDEHLAKGGEASGYHFVFLEDADTPGEAVAYACYGPVPCTAGAYDLYWIAAREGRRGRGLGREVLAAAEAAVLARGGYDLYAETSAREQYAPTRAFYERTGFALAARLADFYAPGEDKCIYAKRLRDPRAPAAVPADAPPA